MLVSSRYYYRNKRLRKLKRRKALLSFFLNLLYVATLFIAGWMVLSYFQVLIHNGDGFSGNPYVYPSWNFFIMFTK